MTMSMSEYELSLVADAKKGKKKALDRLHDAMHKTLCEVIEQELGDRSRAETILRAVFDKLKVRVKSVNAPAEFEQMAIQETISECKNYPKSDHPSEESGATQFTAVDNSKKKQANQPKEQPAQPPVQPSVRQQSSQFARKFDPSAIKRPVRQSAPRSTDQSSQFAQKFDPNAIRRPAQQSGSVDRNPSRRSYHAPVEQLDSLNNPIKGWLVCVVGADRGREFPIKDKVNTIGSSPSSNIRIMGEASIVPDNHACVFYNQKMAECVLQIGKGGSIILNDRRIDQPQILRKFDTITLGGTKLVYAPYSEGLDWKRKFGL